MMLISFHTAKVAALEPTYSEELSNYSYLNYYHTENAARYIEYKEKNKNYSWEQAIIYVNIGLDNEFYSNISPIAEPSRADVLVNKYNQLNADYIPEGLETISAKYSNGSIMLRADSRMAFEKMCKDADSLGLSIKAVSAYRSYKTQSSVYFSKIKKLNTESMAIRDKVSARAGHSEHQLGLAVDVVGTNLWVQYTKEFAWYSRNAYKYGFIIRYPEGKEEITGYEYEPWHLRYIGVELATAVFDSGLSYDEYFTRFIDVEEKAITVLPKTNTVFVDNNSFNFNTYDIDGTSYYRIRDIAQILGGTKKKFEIYWDSENKSMHFHTGMEQHDLTDENPDEADHIAPANEISAESNLEAIVTAPPSPLKTYVNGEEACFIYYEADGYNYLSMEDISRILNLSVTIEPASGYIAINTMTEEAQEESLQRESLQKSIIEPDSSKH